MDNNIAITAVISAIVAAVSAVAGAVVALRRSRAESGNIDASAAEQNSRTAAFMAQNAREDMARIIEERRTWQQERDSLRAENATLRQRVTVLEHDMIEERRTWQQERDSLRVENATLQSRVFAVEADLRGLVAKLAQPPAGGKQ